MEVVHISANDDASEVAGCGILLPGNAIITCGHVINLVFARDKHHNTGLGPSNRQADIQIKFPNIGGQPRATCCVEIWKPPKDRDLALLKVITPLPREAKPGYLSRGIDDEKIAVKLYDIFGGTGRFRTGTVGGRVHRGYFEIVVDDGHDPVEEGSSGAPVLRRDTNEILGVVAGVGEDGSRVYVIPALSLTRMFNGPTARGTLEWRVNFLRNDLLSGLCQDILRASDRGISTSECNGVQTAIAKLFQLTDHVGGRTFWSYYAERDLQLYLAEYLKWNSLTGQTPTVILKRQELAHRLKRIRKNLAQQIRQHQRWLAAEMDESVLSHWFGNIRSLVDEFPITFRTVQTKLAENWQHLTAP